MSFSVRVVEAVPQHPQHERLEEWEYVRVGVGAHVGAEARVGIHPHDAEKRREQPKRKALCHEALLENLDGEDILPPPVVRVDDGLKSCPCVEYLRTLSRGAAVPSPRVDLVGMSLVFATHGQAVRRE
eukprot:6190307-Pleurochrysis_carterae.AAC.4